MFFQSINWLRITKRRASDAFCFHGRLWAAAWFAVCRALRSYLFPSHTHTHSVRNARRSAWLGGLLRCTVYTIHRAHSRTHSICRVYGFTTLWKSDRTFFAVGRFCAAVIRHSRFTRSIQRRDAKPNANDMSCWWCCCLARTHTRNFSLNFN